MEPSLVDEAYGFLRAHLSGRIRFDGERVELRVAPAPDGTLVAPVMVAMLRSVDTVLELPDDSEDGIQLQVTLAQIEESGADGALCDRWCIYHGEPPDVRWAKILIDAARYKGYFVDGQAIVRANPFAAQEPALCKELNAGCRDAVVRAAETVPSGGHRLVDPRVVGVDPWGIDARAQLGVARIPANPPFSAPADVRPRLESAR
jgi:hypothetical protein